MSGIPSTAIEFYTTSANGTEVETGGPGITTVYPRIIAPFNETLTGSSISISLPYTGRESISGTKEYHCGYDIDPFTLTLPGVGALGLFTNSGLEATNIDLNYIDASNLYEDPSNVVLGNWSGTFRLDFFMNSSYICINDASCSGGFIEDLYINNVAVNKGSLYYIPNDTGRVDKYLCSIIFYVEDNTTGVQRVIGDITIENFYEDCLITILQDA